MPATRAHRAGQRLPHWGWLAGTLALGLLLWVLTAVVERNDRTVPAPTERVAGQRQELREGVLPLATVIGDPEAHLDRTVSGTAYVVQVVSDRALWLERDNERLLAVFHKPALTAGSLLPGQPIWLTGRVLDAQQAVGMSPAVVLESETLQVLGQQKAFLLAHAEDFEVLGSP